MVGWSRRNSQASKKARKGRYNDYNVPADEREHHAQEFLAELNATKRKFGIAIIIFALMMGACYLLLR